MSEFTRRAAYGVDGAAYLLGVTRDEVIQRIESGKLRAIKFGKYAVTYVIPATELPKRPKTKGPPPQDCEPGRTDRRLYRSKEQNIFAELHRVQGSKCAICQRPADKHTRLVVDHDHQTGYVRGLLCTQCNNAIGQLQDSPDLLRQAALYLEDNQFAKHKYTYTAASYDRLKVDKVQRRKRKASAA